MKFSRAPYLHDVAWRIQPIPWHHHVPLRQQYMQSTIRVPGGCSVFPCLALLSSILFWGSVGILMPLGLVAGIVPIWVWVAGIVVGSTWIPFLFLGSRQNTNSEYRNWFPVHATCLDLETHWVRVKDLDQEYEVFWAYRMLCEYTHEGQTYRVTPLTFVHFGSLLGGDAKLRRYLKQTIDDNRACTLWVNPDNPWHTLFHKRPKLDDGKAMARLFYSG